MAQEADRLFNDVFTKIKVCFEVSHNANMRCGALLRLLRQKGATEEEIKAAFEEELKMLREFQERAVAERKARDEELKQKQLEQGVEAINAPQTQPEPAPAEAQVEPLVFGGDYDPEKADAPPPSLDSTTSE